ncbi:hypothetical protein LCGC14_1208550 [marine sediment metagenome]|uniref:HTH luxR-type domain-containing protein n=1 Tax=marine sediment metagenome TaxID=412755 RepID=A0A0F9LJ51_9ZZZZ
MSWIVQNLLFDRYRIKESIYKRNDMSNSYDLDFNSEEYNGLLLVEKKISELLNSKILSKRDVRIMELLSQGNIYSDIADELKMSKNSIKKSFLNSCNKIAFSLGGEFTDYGYMNYMIKKYKLKGKEIKKLEELIIKRKRIRS